jgi:UDP-glucose 4-epimerase
MILVTGGLGFLGGRICEELVNSGEEVRIGTSRKKENIQVPDELINCDVVEINLLEPDSLKLACDGIESIIHLAALNAKESNINPKQALLINGLGTLNLLNAAIACSVKKFLYFSTIHVYSSLLDSFTSMNESSFTSPSHHYSITHKLAEDYVLQANKNISVSIFRLSNVIGSPLNKDVNCWMLVAHDLSKQVAVNGYMQLNSNKEVTRDFIGLQNLCKIVCKNIKNSENFIQIQNEIINISSGVAISLDDLTKIIAIESEKIFNFKPKIKYNNLSEKKTESIVISNQKAKSLGFDLKSDLHNEINLLLVDCKRWFIS